MTTFLERTLADLATEFPISAVEGDQVTTYDAERISKTRMAVVQISTDQGCHPSSRYDCPRITTDQFPLGVSSFYRKFECSRLSRTLIWKRQQESLLLPLPRVKINFASIPL